MMSDTAGKPGKSLFIIKSRDEAISAAETYLANHGWTVTSSNHIKDSLSAILENKPDYILVCMDHANPKAQLLPQLLDEALQVKAIVYLEETAPRSLALVSTMEYALYPPISGTAIERMIAKIERDKRRKAAAGKIQIVKGDAGQARQALHQMIKSEESVEALGSAQLDLKPAGAGKAVTKRLEAAIIGENPTTDESAYFAAEVQATAASLNLTGPPDSNETGIAESSQRAIEAVARPNTATPALLSECTEIASFVIQSTNHQGFILCAFAKEAQAFASFVNVFRDKLIEFMSEMDPQVSANTPVQVTVERVRFEDWAKRDAQFVKKFVHMDSECAVAYFNERLILPELRPVTGGMAEMNIADLIAEKKLGFDVFVHLPLNQRFVLYGKRGGKISGRQKSRLRQKGLKAVHVMESEAAEVLRLWMQNFLDQKITEHKETPAQSDAETAQQKYAA